MTGLTAMAMAATATRALENGRINQKKIHVLQEAGAIRECEKHGWMQDRADPHARDRADDFARRNPPTSVSADEAAAAVREALDSTGDTCPECP